MAFINTPEHPVKGWVVSERLRSIWKYLRPIFIFLLSLMMVLCIGYFASRKVYQKFFSPVDPEDRQTVEIELKGSVSTIASTLQENDLIRNAGVFKYYVDFTDRSPTLKAGTYQISKSMTLEEIIELLRIGNEAPSVMKFRIVEGSNVEAVARQLVDQGALEDEARFLELCKTGEAFKDYTFIQDVIAEAQQNPRRYVLEGYLFPDTYEIYVGSSEETIIKKMLVRYQQIVAQYYERAEELNYSMDQITTLASMIEKEAKTNDFEKVSAIFHNRLNNHDRLRSDVTVQYVLGISRMNLTDEDTNTESPYNTYLYPGLPVGAICNPGANAIRAALYPDEEFMNEGYYYFVCADPEQGTMAYAITYDEHMANIEQYRDLWIAWDKAHPEE